MSKFRTEGYLNPIFGFVHGLKTTQQPSRLQGKAHAYEGLLFYMRFGRHICHLTEAGCVCLWGCFTVSSLLKDSTAKKCPERSLNTHTHRKNSPELLVADVDRGSSSFSDPRRHTPHPGWYYIKQTQVIGLTPDIPATFQAKSNTPQDNGFPIV